MDSELINSLANFASPLLSGLLSWFVARQTTNKEIEKQERSWEREAMISSEEDFSAMVSAVSRCIMDVSLPVRKSALEQVAAIRAKETGLLGTALDKLFAAIQTMDYKRIDASLTEVIHQKRAVLSKKDSSNRKK